MSMIVGGLRQQEAKHETKRRLEVKGLAWTLTWPERSPGCAGTEEGNARPSCLFKKQSAMLMPHLQNRDDATCLVEDI